MVKMKINMRILSLLLITYVLLRFRYLHSLVPLFRTPRPPPIFSLFHVMCSSKPKHHLVRCIRIGAWIYDRSISISLDLRDQLHSWKPNNWNSRRAKYPRYSKRLVANFFRFHSHKHARGTFIIDWQRSDVTPQLINVLYISSDYTHFMPG